LAANAAIFALVRGASMLPAARVDVIQALRAE
jgi:hypothetical protein